MEVESLLQRALELLTEEEYLDAAHALRSLAEELEEGATLDSDDLLEILTNIIEG